MTGAAGAQAADGGAHGQPDCIGTGGRPKDGWMHHPRSSISRSGQGTGTVKAVVSCEAAIRCSSMRGHLEGTSD